LPLLSTWFFLWWECGLRDGYKKLQIPAGLLFVALLSGWWFVLLGVREPGFLRFYFFDEHVRRFLDPTYSHTEAFYYYLPVLVAGTLPWSFLTVALLTLRPKLSLSPARVFCAVAGGTIVLFFSAAQGKLAPYILPAIPPLALVAADLIVSCASQREPASARVAAFVSLVLAAAGIVAIAVALSAPRFANPYLILVRPSLILAGLILFLGGGASAFACRQLASRVAAAVICTALTLIAATYGRLEVEPMRSFASFSRAVAAGADDAQIVCYGRYVHALPFYTQRRIVLIGPLSELRFGAERAPDADSYFFSSDDALLKLWLKPRPIVLVIDRPDFNRVQPLLGPYRIIAQARGKLAVLRTADK
jgi:4-amino-4-deoxy-L-arabinose transferase-like glycosyltransferase